jgi:hypothetical protein
MLSPVAMAMVLPSRLKSMLACVPPGGAMLLPSPPTSAVGMLSAWATTQLPSPYSEVREVGGDEVLAVVRERQLPPVRLRRDGDLCQDEAGGGVVGRQWRWTARPYAAAAHRVGRFTCWPC